MKMIGAKAVWVVFQVIFFFLQENLLNQRIKFRRTNKVGKVEVKK